MFRWMIHVFKSRAARIKKDAYLSRHGVDLRCPHCKTWGSDAICPPTIRSFGHPIAVRSRCGQCEKPSYWVCEAGFWFRAEQFGVNIQQEEPTHDA